MSSWWRKVAEARGMTHASTGSWKRRVALGLVTAQPGLTGENWPRILATHGSTNFGSGESWTRRLTPTTQHASGPWSRKLFNAGGPT